MEHLQELCEFLLNGRRGDRGEFEHPDHGPCELRRTKTGYRLTIKEQGHRPTMYMPARARQGKLETIPE